MPLSPYRSALRRFDNTDVPDDDQALMADYCRTELQMIAGHVDPEAVFLGALNKRLTFADLKRLAERTPNAILSLQVHAQP